MLIIALLNYQLTEVGATKKTALLGQPFHQTKIYHQQFIILISTISITCHYLFH
ncbi:MAG: hypothetical protein JWQ79_1878 [Mucilaginibacter sp.]|nr:hypothetical protein [Mucilaginibacter sp.]